MSPDRGSQLSRCLVRIGGVASGGSAHHARASTQSARHHLCRQNDVQCCVSSDVGVLRVAWTEWQLCLALAGSAFVCCP